MIFERFLGGKLTRRSCQTLEKERKFYCFASALLSDLLRSLLCNTIREVYCTTRCFVYKTTAVVLKTAKGNLGNKLGFS